MIKEKVTKINHMGNKISIKNNQKIDQFQKGMGNVTRQKRVNIVRNARERNFTRNTPPRSFREWAYRHAEIAMTADNNDISP